MNWKLLILILCHGIMVFLCGCNNDVAAVTEPESTRQCPADTGDLKDLLDQIAESNGSDDRPKCGCEDYPISTDTYDAIYSSVNELLGTTYGCHYIRKGPDFARTFQFWLFSDPTMGGENFVILPIYWDDIHDGPQACGWYYFKGDGGIWCGLY